MGSFQIARVFGIPIRAHITLIIVLAFIAVEAFVKAGSGAILVGSIMVVGLLASVVLHEVGHSLVAIRKGCHVRDILLLPIGGVAQLDSLPTNPRDEFQVAIAGPVVSFVLALLTWGASDLLKAIGWPGTSGLLDWFSKVNLMLLLFNLLPSFPMDGGRIFRAWLSPRVGRLIATQIASKVGRFIAILFGVAAVFYYHDIFLLIIAVFIYQAAGAEYRMVRIQEASRNGPFGPWMKANEPWTCENEEITVSPPPFRSSGTSHIFVKPLRAQHDLFDDLFDKWR